MARAAASAWAVASVVGAAGRVLGRDRRDIRRLGGLRRLARRQGVDGGLGGDRGLGGQRGGLGRLARQLVETLVAGGLLGGVGGKVASAASAALVARAASVARSSALMAARVAWAAAVAVACWLRRAFWVARASAVAISDSERAASVASADPRPRLRGCGASQFVFPRHDRRVERLGGARGGDGLGGGDGVERGQIGGGKGLLGGERRRSWRGRWPAGSASAAVSGSAPGSRRCWR